MNKDNKPNCYECKYRQELPGSAHSQCTHPSIGKPDPMMKAFSVLSGSGRGLPTIDMQKAVELGIKADQHGIMKGWFNWPYNFDPVWLRECKGFEPKQKEQDNGSK